MDTDATPSSTWTGSMSHEHIDNPKQPDTAPPATPKTETSSLSDLPDRATTVTPVLSEILARFEGVPRWGINE